MELFGRRGSPFLEPVNLQEATMARPLMKSILGCWLLVGLGSRIGESGCLDGRTLPGDQVTTSGWCRGA